MKKIFLLVPLFVFSACGYHLSNTSEVDSTSHLITSNEITSNETSSPNSSNTITLDGYSPYDDAFVGDFVDIEDGYQEYQFNQPYIKDKVGSEDENIYFTSLNDCHGTVYFRNNEGYGFDHTAYFLDNDNVNSINLLVGDIFQGGYLSNIVNGDSFVDLINILDFDCFVIGNHEFDWGLDNLKRLKDGDLTNKELLIPFLGANIYYKGTDIHPNFIDPYMIVNYGETKVGIIGLIGDDLENSIDSNRVSNYEFKNSLSLTKYYAKLLRNEYEVDIVTVAIHDYDEGLFRKFASLEGEEKIDIVFGGHTHYRENQYFLRNDNSRLYCFQSGANNEGIMSVTLSSNGDVAYQFNYYSKDSRDKKIIDYLEENYGDIIDTGYQVIKENNQYITREEIGNQTVTYLKQYYEASAAVINTAGVRDYFKGRDITNNEIFKVYPFDNQVLDVYIDGYNLKRLLFNQADFIYSSSDDNIKNDRNTFYHLIVIDYVYLGSYYRPYLQNSYFKNLDITIREAYINYLKAN